MATITDPILPTGQWCFTHDLAACADGTARGAVALAKRAGCRGLLVKWSDGGSLYAAGGARSLIEAAKAAGLATIPWGYTYPGDGDNVARLAASAVQVTGQPFFVLDAETEFSRSTPAEAEALLTACCAQSGVRWLYTSLPWPSTQPDFPWGVFQARCAGFLPQLYPVDLAGVPDPSPEWVGRCWHLGVPEWEALSPQRPTVPILQSCQRPLQQAGTAFDSGFRTVAWWVLDHMTEAQADALAMTPYATRPAQSPAEAPVTAPGPSAVQAQLQAYREAVNGFVFDLKGRGLVK